MVQMMLVRRKALGGWYSVLRLLSHSARVLPNSAWARELAMMIDFRCHYEGRGKIERSRSSGRGRIGLCVKEGTGQMFGARAEKRVHERCAAVVVQQQQLRLLFL